MMASSLAMPTKDSNIGLSVMVPNPLWIQCCHCELWMYTSQALQGLNAKSRPSMILQHDSLRQSLAFNNLLIVPWYSWHFTTIGLLTLGFPIVNCIVEYTNSSHHWFTIFTLFPLRDHAIQSFEDETFGLSMSRGKSQPKQKTAFEKMARTCLVTSLT